MKTKRFSNDPVLKKLDDIIKLIELIIEEKRLLNQKFAIKYAKK